MGVSTVSCCGRERMTAYCPDCGKALDYRGVLGGLLDHIAARVRQHKNRVAFWQARVAEHKYSDEGLVRVKRCVAAEQHVLAKWRSWDAALKKLLECAGDR